MFWAPAALERGIHALNSGMDVKAYAASVGRERTTVLRETYAAEVASVCHVAHDLSDQFRALSEVHAAPRWLWSALVSAMVESKWTLEATRKARNGRIIPELGSGAPSPGMASGRRRRDGLAHQGAR